MIAGLNGRLSGRQLAIDLRWTGEDCVGLDSRLSGRQLAIDLRLTAGGMCGLFAIGGSLRSIKRVFT